MTEQSNLSALEQFVMPFGKHEGKKLGDIPLKYLDWVRGVPLEPPYLEAKKKVREYMAHPLMEKELKEELSE